jgi:hypothetical protein
MNSNATTVPVTPSDLDRPYWAAVEFPPGVLAINEGPLQVGPTSDGVHSRRLAASRAAKTNSEILAMSYFSL